MIFIGPLQWRQIFDLDAERTLEALHDCLQLIFRRGIDVLEGQFAELVAVAALATDAYPALVYFAPARHRVGALTLPGVVREVKAAGRGRQGGWSAGGFGTCRQSLLLHFSTQELGVCFPERNPVPARRPPMLSCYSCAPFTACVVNSHCRFSAIG
jgi:hypothetical protein